MKKWLAAALSLSLLAAAPAYADVVSELEAAEKVFGIDNSDKTAVERVGILEEQLGIEASDGTLAERLDAIEDELGISDADAQENVSDTAADIGTEESTNLAVAPSDEFVMERLKLIGTITETAAVTEDHDPNGQLGKQGGYIGCIYFTDSQVDRSLIFAPSDDVIDTATEGGGAIEIFATKADAEAREAYLATFDGTAFSSGSHRVVGTCLVRTSIHLTASQQNTLTDQIEQVLTAEDVTDIQFDAPAAVEQTETDAASGEENDGYLLYSQDGYSVTAMGFEDDDPILGSTLKLRIQNLTHRNVTFFDNGSYINGSMVMLGLYFDIASGKTKTDNVYIDSQSLKDAGIDQIEDITLNLMVSDQDTFDTLATIGPLSITFDEEGNITNKVVYRDAATIQEVQTLLNAAGYDCGAADGVAGKLTNDMILQFERDHGLREDTDITDELLEALRNS